MSIHTRVYHVLNILALLGLLMAPMQPLMQPSPTPAQAQAAPSSSGTGLFRTRVEVRNASDRARLDKLGVVVLETIDPSPGPSPYRGGESGSLPRVGGGLGWGSAVVLADADQLEVLARLRFEPQASDDLGLLVSAQGPEKGWLQTSLKPLLTKAAAVQEAVQRCRGAEVQGSAGAGETASPEVAAARAELRAAMHSLTAEQQAAIASLTSVDDDADGLTNTEEQWWCTDPMNPNSDGDAQGYTDGQEVAALLDFTLPRSVRWGYGPPFGPPNAWPDWNGQDGNPATPACNDGDHDTIPDYAEAFMVGSRVPEESTDHDKFDDGQELFGVTYCPGAPTNCGYGSYPAVEYWNYIKATMPSWVLPPGDNLFVAAFPVPEVSVVPGSWTVERVTTITTSQGQMTETTNSYETSVTRGESTSIANTVTWNNWEEVSQAVETPLSLSQKDLARSSLAPLIDLGKVFNGVMWMGAGAGAELVAGTQLPLCASGIGCVVPMGLATVGVGLGSYGWDVLKEGWNSNPEGSPPNDVQSQRGANSYDANQVVGAITTPNVQTSVAVVNDFDAQGIVNSLDGVQYAINQQGALLARGLHDISYAISQPRFTETRTSGHSWGGAQTTTHEVYEEHTISEGQAFTTGENWSTAWAVDSSHAADLTFTYTISNTGTEYARELTGVIFNIYLGDDKTPVISYPAWQQFPNGKLENVFPGSANTFASTRVPLTLEQMKRIDLGERLTVVLEDFSYGADELFYQDAVNGGVTVFIEDGVDDGDELVDMYVIPTWSAESVQDVLTRYFPAGYDVDGYLNALWTPEFDGINPPTWYEHYLSDISWWNVYLTQADAGNTPLKDLPAVAGSALLFRFNRDSDRDGYNDRVEMRYGTDKNDPASHPYPEVLAGYVASRSGNTVTVKLVLENSGTFDAYGIDAVMYAPDSTTTISNNTVGGNGRVRPGAQVAVGSLVKPPDLTNWGSSTAKPYAGGNYSGTTDRTYTFNVTTPGVVGQGSTAMNWSDGAGDSGTLALGSSYHAPLPLDVAQGLQVGFNTGTMAAGAGFTVEALTPRDTFTYTVNSEPFTPPVIVVSYSDPQGSHRFITPVELPSLDSDLAPYSGQMLKGLALEIQTTGPVTTTSPNTTNFVFSSPHTAAIQDAHLYLDFVSDGALVAHLPYTLTLQPGPTVYPVSWSTSAFTQTYDPDADNILIAFWTDAQGNIIDSAARPLNTFAADPKPAFAMSAADATWDFGTAAQGTLLRRTIAVGSVGFMDLLTYVGSTPGLSISGQGSRRLPPADVALYDLTLKTADLPEGPFERTLAIRTSDPEHPTRTITIRGNITPLPPDAPGGATLRPLDWSAAIPGDHSQGEWVEFTHTLGPDQQTLHPVKVYSQDYGTLWGVGEYATSFGQGTTPYNMFGDGRDSNLTVAGIVYSDNTRSSVNADVAVGSTQINVATTTGFSTGQEVLLIQSRGPGAGKHELHKIAGVDPNARTITLDAPVTNAYSTAGSARVQVILVRNYQNVTVSPGSEWRPSDWDGNTGGVLVARVADTFAVQPGGVINVSGMGYWGGNGVTYGGQWSSPAWSGEGIDNPNVQRQQTWSPDNGGPGGVHAVDFNPAGASGGNGTGGERGYGFTANPAGAVGDSSGNLLIFGGGGGGSMGEGSSGGKGGEGGGIVLILAKRVVVDGEIRANGAAATQGGNRGGGGGAGGWIKIVGSEVSLGDNRLIAQGGAGGGGGDSGGTGGKGRIRVEYCNTFSGSTNNPVATLQHINCYIVEQVESAPYDRARLNLPESFTGGRTYKVQYGRRYVFSAAGQQTSYLRLPKQLYASASLDALVSDTGVSSGGLNLSLDIGNDGTADWSYNGTTNFPATFTITNVVSALNAYLVSRSDVAWGADVDVPVRVQIDRQADVMLTNLALTPVGAKTRFLRLPARSYSDVTLSLQFSQPGVPSGRLAFTVDVGADGSVDWSYAGTPSFPAILTSPNLAAAFNTYLSGRTGEVDVPLRIVPSPSLDTALYDFGATPADRPDITLSDADIDFGAASPTEGDNVPVTATLHNTGPTDSGPLTAAFFATPPAGFGEAYIGSDFVSNVPASGSADATIQWNTLGFTGDVPVRVVVDPFDRVAETHEDNNEAAASLTILTRPDLRVAQIALSDDEPVAGQSVTVTLTLSNAGQTTAGASTLALYDGNPASGGALVGQGTPTVPGEDETTLDFTWTPTAPGPYRLFAVSDRDEDVNEFDEGNNQSWQDVYVGFAGPLLVDSGGASDVAYTASVGYGYLNGQASTFCGTSPDQTQRSDLAGRVQYRFDHLLPGHFYHLNITLLECDNAGRQENILVDDNLLGGPIDLADGQMHRLSFRLDPALYADHSIVVSIQELLGNDAVVSSVDLYDVDYRYADAGGSGDLAYTSERSYGWLDGVEQTTWGSMPYQTRRIDLGDSDPTDDPDNELRYRFDRLSSARRYQLHLTFYQGATGTVQQRIAIDDMDSGAAVELNDVQRADLTIDVPVETYRNDDSIIVTIRRTNSSTNAFVNEISLEEKTLLTQPAIQDIQIANVSDNAASISWLTDAPANGWVHYGTTPALGQIDHDDRGALTSGQTHHVTLAGLTPSTTYYFYVLSADAIDDNGGSYYQFTTGPALSPRLPDTVYGQVFGPDGSTPAQGVLVYLTLQDADGQGSPGQAAVVSALVDASGYWNANLANARTRNYQQWFLYSSSGDRVHLAASQGTGCSAEQVVDTANDSPAPAMTLTCPTQVAYSLSAGWNLWGLNVISDPPLNAESALDDIAAQGGSTSEVNRWLNGGWDSHIKDLPFNNFALELGQGYFFKTTTASTWQCTGRPPSNPLLLNLGPGWNLVAFPKLTCTLTAEGLLDGIAAQGGACSEVDRWRFGGWEGHIKDLPFNNFEIRNDQGYFVKCSQSSTYVPCQGTALSLQPSWPAPIGAEAWRPQAEPAVHDVLVTNRRDVAFSVSWRTDRPATGWVVYGDGDSTDLSYVADDDRGQGVVSTLHHVTLTGLNPETTYAFRVHSGGSIADLDGSPYRVTLTATDVPPVPLTAYGQVKDRGGKPVVGALVVAWLRYSDGRQLGPLSALVDGWGYWVLSLPAEASGISHLILEAISPSGDIARLTQPVCECQPAPTLTLSHESTNRLYMPIIMR